MVNKSSNSFFIILSPARSRSSFLRHLINSHPLVVCHGEIFHPKKIMVRVKDIPTTDVLYNMQWRDKHPLLYVERLIHQSKFYSPHAILMGCKLLMNEGQLSKGFQTLLKFNPKVMMLRRDNKLAWYSSLKIAKETNNWGGQQQKHKQHKVIFDANEFELMVQHQNNLYRKCKSKLLELKISFLEFEYNEFDNEQSLTKILNFLDLPKFNLTSETLPINHTNILQRFTNPHTVEKYLKHQPLTITPPLG